MSLTTLERDTARASLDMDEREATNAEVIEYLDQLATEIAQIRRLADAVPTDYASEFTTLALVEAVGWVRKPRGHVAGLVNLLALMQDAAVKQARAHGVTWSAIAERTHESQPNLITRFKNK